MMEFYQYIVKDGQSLADVAMSEYGTLDGLILLMEDNTALSEITDEPAAGTVLNIRFEPGLESKEKTDYVRQGKQYQVIRKYIADPAGNATVKNSDNTYNVSVAPDTIHNLPDITVNIDGNTSTHPAAKGLVFDVDIEVDFTANTTETSNVSAVNFTAAAPDAEGFLWLFGDGSSSKTENPSHLYSAPGLYTVTLIAGSASLNQAGVKVKEDYIAVSEAEGGLLQTIPNSHLGLALRFLNAAYVGPCMKIRRDSDNQLADIYFSANGLDVLAVEEFIEGGNAYVHTWYDQSGNGRNAVQATSSNQPQLVITGAEPYLDFNGTTHQMDITFGSPTVVDSFLTFYYDSTLLNRAMFANPNANQMAMYQSGLSSIRVKGASNQTNTKPIDYDTIQLAQGQFSGVNSFIQVNNNAPGTAPADIGSVATTTLRLAMDNNGSYWKGRYYELLMWPSALVSGDATTVRNNINTFYTIF